MAMTEEEVSACSSCISDNKGFPPCLAPNERAHAKGHPIVTFVSIASTTIKWPCYFHADWNFLAPLLIGRAPKDKETEHYEDSDLRLTANPEGSSQIFLKMMSEGLHSLVGSKSSEALTLARGEFGRRAAEYYVNGNQALFRGQFAVLYSSHRDDRFRTWVKTLERFHRCQVPMLPLEQSSWNFTTYGSGGAMGVNGGHIVLQILQNATKNLYYAGYGVSASPLPKIAAGKFSPKTIKRLDKSQVAGGPTSFTTVGMVLKNTMVYAGTAEPTTFDMSGFCLIASASAAAAAGLSGSGPWLGMGGDISLVMVLPRLNVIFAMAGKTSLLSLPNAGIYFGFIAAVD